MFEKLKRYLAKKLLPYVEVKPLNYEITSLDVETLRCEFCVPKNVIISNEQIKTYLADMLCTRLKHYIDIAATDNIIKNCTMYTGVIRIVKKR